MESKPTALVKSPSRKKHYHLKNAKGFSLAEIKKSGKTLNDLKNLGIHIDYFRKSSHDSNVDQLKKLKLPERKIKKREAFVKKEKKRTPFKPKTEKKNKATKPNTKPKTKVKPKSTITQKTPALKQNEILVKTPTIETKTPIKEEPIPKDKVTPLTALTGLGATTAKKFESVGVSCVEDLCKQNPGELAIKIKGATETRIETWIKEAKQKLQEGK
ncbi:MAG: ribosomal protein L13e [Candidatus Lokiarchaeota archaeon]|nr:ribosomal protein L13e [Candidatus Lokiarchaeota archaeon]